MYLIINHKLLLICTRKAEFCAHARAFSLSLTKSQHTHTRPPSPRGRRGRSLWWRREHPNCSMSHRKAKLCQALVAWVWCSQSKRSTHHVSMWIYRMINLSEFNRLLLLNLSAFSCLCPVLHIISRHLYFFCQTVQENILDHPPLEG